MCRKRMDRWTIYYIGLVALHVHRNKILCKIVSDCLVLKLRCCEHNDRGRCSPCWLKCSVPARHPRQLQRGTQPLHVYTASARQ